MDTRLHPPPICCDPCCRKWVQMPLPDPVLNLLGSSPFPLRGKLASSSISLCCVFLGNPDPKTQYSEVFRPLLRVTGSRGHSLDGSVQKARSPTGPSWPGGSTELPAHLPQGVNSALGQGAEKTLSGHQGPPALLRGSQMTSRGSRGFMQGALPDGLACGPQYYQFTQHKTLDGIAKSKDPSLRMTYGN